MILGTGHVLTEPAQIEQAPTGSGTRFIQPYGIASTASVGKPSLLNPSTTGQIFVGSLNYSDSAAASGLTSGGIKKSTAKITKNINSGSKASFVLRFVTGTLPQPNDPIAIYWNGIKRFAGIISDCKTESIMGNPSSCNVTVNCTGNQDFASRITVARLYSQTLSPNISGVLSIIVQDIVDKSGGNGLGLAQFGVRYQLSGNPSSLLGDQLFPYLTDKEALDRLKAQLPGWDWWIDDALILHFAQTDPSVASVNAPFSVTRTGNFCEKFSSTVSAARFRNFQNVLLSGGTSPLYTDTIVADGVNVNFPVTYAQLASPLVNIGGVDVIVSRGDSLDPGWGAYWVPGTTFIFLSSIPAAGTIITVRYKSPFPLAVTAQDATSIASVGLYEATQHSNMNDLTSGQDEADGLLEIYGQDGTFPQKVEFQYTTTKQSEWLDVGMIITVNWTFPTVNGNYVVEEVSSKEVGFKLWRHNAILRAGPGDVTDAQAIQAWRELGRKPPSTPPTAATFELDLLNAGQVVGIPVNRYVVRLPSGVLSIGIRDWDGYFPTNPPTGSSYILDMLLSTDGGLTYVSLFPDGNSNKITVPDGSTSLLSGFHFRDNALRLKDGYIIKLNVIQVGSTNPGKYSVFHLNFIQ